MKLAPFTTKEEICLWDDMRRELRKHSNYYVRKEYYPFNMELWETKRKSIEDGYRSKILDLQKEMKARKIQERKREKKEVLKSATALFSNTKKKEIVIESLRRSTRIANV